MFRRRSLLRRAGFILALAAALCASAIPLPHADGFDDPACTAVPVAHDESAHYVAAGPAPAQAHADHCYLCHTLRSFHSAFDTFQPHADTPHAERLPLAQTGGVGLLAWTLVPGRAPPV